MAKMRIFIFQKFNSHLNLCNLQAVIRQCQEKLDKVEQRIRQLKTFATLAPPTSSSYAPPSTTPPHPSSAATTKTTPSTPPHHSSALTTAVTSVCFPRDYVNMTILITLAVLVILSLLTIITMFWLVRAFLKF